MRIGVGGLLLIGLAGLLLTVGGVAAVLVVRLVGAEAEQAVLEQHRARAIAVAESLEAACRSGDCAAALGAIKPRAAVAVAVIGARGQIIGGAIPYPLRRAPEVSDALLGGTPNWAEVERPPDHPRGAGADHLVARPVHLPSGRAAVVMLFTLDSIRAGVAARQRVVVGYLLVAIVAVLLFGFYLAHRFIAAPIRDLTARAEAVTMAADDVWPNPVGPREVARLSVAFGEMVQRIRAQHASLARQLAALETARDELIRSEKLATVGRLAAGVAHEVGNPLAAVMGYIEYLRGDEAVEAALRADLLGRVDRELRRISETVRELLDFSRPGAASPALMSLVEVAVEAKELVRFQKTYGGIEIAIEGSAPTVLADPVRMRQVFLNLFLNAADAMNGEGCVRTSISREGDFAQVTVVDEGPGIDAETAAQLFEPFFTTKPRGSGTGMGLAVCQQLVDEAGGRIWLASEPGTQGSVFAFRLPLGATRIPTEPS